MYKNAQSINDIGTIYSVHATKAKKGKETTAGKSLLQAGKERKDCEARKERAVRKG